MERTLTISQASGVKATPEPASIFGLYYLEETEFDLNEVVGCFGASSVDAPGIAYTSTCPYDDSDTRDEHPT